MTASDQPTPPSSARDMLRHALATLAYRAGKVLRDTPDGFDEFRAADDTRTAGRILAHMGDLMDWGLHMASGEQVWSDSKPRSWDDEVDRFFAALAAFDARLADPEPLGYAESRLFQGPVADAIHHTGQLAMMRRMHGAPVRGENYFKAEIETGRVGKDQAAPVREFG